MKMLSASRFWQWCRKKPFAAFTLAIILLVALATLYGVARPARHDRDWVDHLSRLPHVNQAQDVFAVVPLRDWTYDANGPVAQHWIDTPQEYAVDQLRNVWLMVEPHPGLEAMAHTLVLFEFADDRLLGLTIEARREKDEGFDAFWGNWGRFELIYVWASARDLLTRRAVYLDHDVQVFPLTLTDDQRTDFLHAVLAETERIEARPRLYNTLFSNCTNELAKAARLDWDPAFVTTGHAASRLHEMGVIPPSDEPFALVRQRASIADDLKLLNLLPPASFDAAFLTLLRARSARNPATGTG